MLCLKQYFKSYSYNDIFKDTSFKIKYDMNQMIQTEMKNKNSTRNSGFEFLNDKNKVFSNESNESNHENQIYLQKKSIDLSKKDSKSKEALKAKGNRNFFQDDIRKYYKFGSLIGEGRFGEIRVCSKIDNQITKLFCVKSIFKLEHTKENIDMFINEINILLELDHPYIIKIHEVFEDEYFMHFVVDFCQGGDLFDRIREEGQVFEDTAKEIVFKILSAVGYCHAKGIIHRDLKPENIIFENKKRSESQIRIIDFNLSCKKAFEELMLDNTIGKEGGKMKLFGTPFYMAPEFLAGKDNDKSDIWAIGIITYSMLSGNLPFYSCNNSDIFKKIIHAEPDFRGEEWKKISPSAINFIKRCLVKNPIERFNAKEALNDNWLSTIKEISIVSPTKSILFSLKNYSEKFELRKMAKQAFIEYLLPQEEYFKLKSIFISLSKQNNGIIKASDLENIYTSARIFLSKNEIKNIITKLNNKDNNQTKQHLEMSEFLLGVLNISFFNNIKTIEKLFHLLDFDGDNKINTNDIIKFQERQGKAINPLEAEQIIRDFKNWLIKSKQQSTKIITKSKERNFESGFIDNNFEGVRIPSGNNTINNTNNNEEFFNENNDLGIEDFIALFQLDNGNFNQ